MVVSFPEEDCSFDPSGGTIWTLWPVSHPTVSTITSQSKTRFNLTSPSGLTLLAFNLEIPIASLKVPTTWHSNWMMPISGQATINFLVVGGYAKIYLNGSSFQFFVGSSGTLDLIPYGNPRCTNIAWLVKGQVLKRSPIDPRKDDLSKKPVKKTLSKLTGLYQLDELLVIWNVKRNQATNVTIQAANSLGTTEATFFLDVTCKLCAFWGS